MIAILRHQIYTEYWYSLFSIVQMLVLLEYLISKNIANYNSYNYGHFALYIDIVCA